MSQDSFIFSSKFMYISTIIVVGINVFMFPELLSHPDMKLNDLSYLAYDQDYIVKLRDSSKTNASRNVDVLPTEIDESSMNKNKSKEEVKVQSTDESTPLSSPNDNKSINVTDEGTQDSEKQENSNITEKNNQAEDSESAKEIIKGNLTKTVENKENKNGKILEEDLDNRLSGCKILNLYEYFNFILV